MEIILTVFIFLLGAIFASFFGVVIGRVPAGLSIVKPNSRCDSCGHELAWYENIPIFSYIFLGGKCKNCKAKIGISSLLYEVIGGIVTGLGFIMFFKLGNPTSYVEAILAVLIGLILLLMAGFDYKTNTILDIFWIIFAVLVAALTSYRVFVLKSADISYWQAFKPYLWGVIASTVFFVLIKVVFYLILHQDPLGNGDIIVMSIAGFLLGLKSLLFSLLVASILGCVIELTLIGLKKKNQDTPIPFLPYLNLGIYVAFLFGDKIMNLLLKGVI